MSPLFRLLLSFFLCGRFRWPLVIPRKGHAWRDPDWKNRKREREKGWQAGCLVDDASVIRRITDKQNERRWFFFSFRHLPSEKKRRVIWIPHSGPCQSKRGWLHPRSRQVEYLHLFSSFFIFFLPSNERFALEVNHQAQKNLSHATQMMMTGYRLPKQRTNNAIIQPPKIYYSLGVETNYWSPFHASSLNVAHTNRLQISG